jgi:hypothetical protein
MACGYNCIVIEYYASHHSVWILWKSNRMFCAIDSTGLGTNLLGESVSETFRASQRHIKRLGTV